MTDAAEMAKRLPGWAGLPYWERKGNGYFADVLGIHDPARSWTEQPAESDG